jgi:GNAT superfamily N-acetyltransferase
VERRLRRAEHGDEAALSLVAGATFLEAYSAFMDRGDLLAHLAAKSSPACFRAWIADPACIVTLAEAPAGAAPLGYTVLTPCDLPVERRSDDLELLRIYALATGWGSGLGGALMERALADARAAGAGRLLLGTHPANHRAQRFYEKHDFSVVGRRQFRVGNSVFDDPVYARVL